ncbi:hypothetical protein FRC12_003206 [Ceratobasidium sp. 428]|nr:hypothetical protein FRC12_003206 [Ceratobasidium sp. 428]
MFEYLSFLRPPPERCALGQPVTLVPQIANDLRTELCEDQYDIYFTWQHSNGHLHRGNFTKLTTWRPGGMYKPLSIALPAVAQPGECWRLCLVVVQPGRNPSLMLDLSQPTFGDFPFPVTSMPIDIVVSDTVADRPALSSTSAGSKHIKKSRQTKPTSIKPSRKGTAVGNAEHTTQTSQSNAPKQERIERFYLLPPSPDPTASRTMCITEQTSFDLDKKIWDSGVAVSAWLARLLDTRTELAASEANTTHPKLVNCLRNRLIHLESRGGRTLQIIELGAGTGLVSLVLGALLFPVVQPLSTATIHVRILATDLASAIELIEHNRDTNKHLLQGSSSNDEEQDQAPLIELRGIELDWDKPIADDIWYKELETGSVCPFDIIVMADVTYNTASFSALLDTVVALLNGPGSSSSSPMILLAYKCRDAAERTLWRDAAARGVSFVQIDSARGAGEPAVEIWLGGWEKDVSSLWGKEQK